MSYVSENTKFCEQDKRLLCHMASALYLLFRYAVRERTIDCRTSPSHIIRSEFVHGLNGQLSRNLIVWVNPELGGSSWPGVLAFAGLVD
jgi:hypothetical protein